MQIMYLRDKIIFLGYNSYCVLVGMCMDGVFYICHSSRGVFASSFCKYSFEMRNNLQKGLYKCFILSYLCWGGFLCVSCHYDGRAIAIALFGQ